MKKEIKRKKKRKIDWDNPDPKLQYNIWKGFGNPIPRSHKHMANDKPIARAEKNEL